MAVFTYATFGNVTYRGSYYINQHGFVQFQGYPVEEDENNE